MKGSGICEGGWLVMCIGNGSGEIEGSVIVDEDVEVEIKRAVGNTRR